MVVGTLNDEEVDRIFQALADRTRRDIVRRTMLEDASVSTLARRYDMSFAAVQKHVAVLQRADLVTKRRHGREQLVRTNPATIRLAQQLLDQLEAMWRDRLDRLGGLLDATSPESPEPPAESEHP
ncbi:MAG TPA: metalloregulator ArsR/SmtB family transcription factor [Ilumatobacteraceae bacterium]|nr:metalloregulator ArsR/SmtB family transcription factor [Ilumatobacteraceae bacterium]